LLSTIRYAARLLLVTIAGAMLAGCATVDYYAQAVGGHLEVMSNARPIEEVLAEKDVPQAVRQRLELSQRVREFLSAEMQLPDNGSYRSYADLGRPYVVWNVIATDRFSVEPVRACFLFAGCFDYRGFFSKADASAAAAELANQGKDVHIAGATAYSTLGWFSDPLLSTLVEGSEAKLVGTMGHELAHQKLYVKGDSAFSEAFAVAMGGEAIKRWFRHTEQPEAYRAYLDRRNRRREFNGLLLKTRQELSEIYASELAAADKKEAKRAAFGSMRKAYATLKENWGGYSGYDRWMSGELNNARLALVSTYNRLVPAFDTLLNAHKGDIKGFVTAAREMADLPLGERRERMLALIEEEPVLASKPDDPSRLVTADSEP